ncbi:hypothetical protein LTS18_008797, partial [Coniosporium uncinatum]
MPVDVNGLTAELEQQEQHGGTLEEDMGRLTLGSQSVCVEKGETGSKLISDDEKSPAPSER